MSQRFTDAELAAEYWAMHLEGQVAITQELSASCNEEHKRAEYWGEELGRIAPKLQALQRFATLPHAHDPEPRTVYAYDQHGRCIGSFADPRPEEPFRNWSINTGKDD